MPSAARGIRPVGARGDRRRAASAQRRYVDARRRAPTAGCGSSTARLVVVVTPAASVTWKRRTDTRFAPGARSVGAGSRIVAGDHASRAARLERGGRDRRGQRARPDGHRCSPGRTPSARSMSSPLAPPPGPVEPGRRRRARRPAGPITPPRDVPSATSSNAAAVAGSSADERFGGSRAAPREAAFSASGPKKSPSRGVSCACQNQRRTRPAVRRPRGASPWPRPAASARRPALKVPAPRRRRSTSGGRM